jgi:putative chitinase
VRRHCDGHSKEAKQDRTPPKRHQYTRPAQTGRRPTQTGEGPQDRTDNAREIGADAPTSTRPRAPERTAAGPAPGCASLAAFTTLRPGATGDAVTRLQRRLSERGFKCGAIDGEFGHGTEAAVIAFQMSESLLPDGVAGPRTLTALGLMEDDRLPSSTGELTVQVVSDMCPGAPLGNIKAYLPAVIEAMSELELVDKSMLLMAVATICAETGRFAPLDEYRSRYNTSPNARAPFFDLYDHRRDLGNRGPHDGAAYKGRGFVQLTGRANYEQLGRALGFGELLLREPERANEPLVAARVLARFLKDRELKIKNALLERDFALARRYVNGGRHGLPEFTASFLSGERLLA